MPQFYARDGEVKISLENYQRFYQEFPELDVAASMRGASSYLRCNRQCRPAADNMLSFLQRWLMNDRKDQAGKPETPWQKDMREREQMALYDLKRKGLTPADFGLEGAF